MCAGWPAPSRPSPRPEDPRGGNCRLRHALSSQQAARLVSEVLSAAGIPVKITSDYTPTPAISFAVKSQGAAGGVVVTSSHNPFNWNGVKFKAKFGGSATPAIMKVIEEEVGAGSMPKGPAAPIKEVDLKPAYMEAFAGSRTSISSPKRISVRGRFHVRFGARRADRDLPESRHQLRRHPPGNKPAVSRDQSRADRAPHRDAAADWLKEVPCRAGHRRRCRPHRRHCRRWQFRGFA